MSFDPTLEVIRQPEGFTFLLDVDKEDEAVRVFVCDEALSAHHIASDAAQLRAQFEEERAELEEVARQKYERGRVTMDGLIVITLCDVLGFVS